MPPQLVPLFFFLFRSFFCVHLTLADAGATVVVLSALFPTPFPSSQSESQTLSLSYSILSLNSFSLSLSLLFFRNTPDTHMLSLQPAISRVDERGWSKRAAWCMELLLLVTPAPAATAGE